MYAQVIRVIRSPAKLTLMGRAIQFASQIAMVLVVPKVLVPELYLQFSLVIPVAMLAASLLFGWLRSSMHRHVYELLDPEDSGVRETALAYYSVLSLVLLGAFLLVFGQTESIYRLVPLLLIASALKTNVLGVLNASHNHRGFLLANLGFALSLVVFIGLCLVRAQDDLVFYLMAYAILDILIASVAWAAIGVAKIWPLPCFDSRIAARYFRYGLPLMSNALVIWVISVSDRYLMTIWESTETIAAYILSYQLAASVITMPMSFFIVIMFPRVLQIEKDQDTAAALAYTDRLMKLYLRYSPVFFLVGCAVVLPLKYYLYPEYVFNPWIIIVIVLAHVIYGLANFVNKEFELNGKTLVITKGVAAGAVTNVVLNLALIPLAGALGAAVATLIAYSLAVWLVYSHGFSMRILRRNR